MGVIGLMGMMGMLGVMGIMGMSDLDETVQHHSGRIFVKYFVLWI